MKDVGNFRKCVSRLLFVLSLHAALSRQNYFADLWKQGCKSHPISQLGQARFYAFRH